MYAIKTVELTKTYKDTVAVSGVSIDVLRGEVFGLLGTNGAGKTTLIKLLTCLTKPSGGDASVAGHSIIADPLAVKRSVGVSPQETAVAPNLSVLENLRLICGINGITGTERDARIAELAERLGLDSVLTKRAGKLSGGFQRRLSIAMALVSEPEILFLDEPTLGLDVIARSELWDVIRALRGRATVILTTHYMEEAEALCDRIAIMKDGAVLTVGSAQQIISETGAEDFESAFIRAVRGENRS